MSIEDMAISNFGSDIAASIDGSIIIGGNGDAGGNAGLGDAGGNAGLGGAGGAAGRVPGGGGRV